MAPRTFGFADQSGAATAVPIVIGAAILLMSAMTNDELGLARVIAMVPSLLVAGATIPAGRGLRSRERHATVWGWGT